MRIGQTIYLKPIGNAARYKKDIIKTEVTKVGRKYFEVEYFGCGRLSIEQMVDDRGEYISNYAAYLSMQEIEDEKEYQRLYDKIKSYFSGYGTNKSFSLQQLREINHFLPKN